MQTFTIGLGRLWWIRAFGRNPLVRRSDRIEAAVFMLAVLIVVITTPVAGAIGTSVHDAHARLYAEEAHHRHQVIATAIEDGAVVPHPNTVLFTVRAKWSAAGHDHSGIVAWADQARAGEQRDIWVNDQGEQVGPPSPLSRAVDDAVAIAVLVWVGVAAAAAGSVYVVRRWLDRRRYLQWDREINACAGDGWANNPS